jgi:hypothetical protein
MGKELLNSDKELLLIDLCARLPYGVKCQIKGEEDFEPLKLKSFIQGKGFCAFDFYIKENSSLTFKELDEFKPYLFPLSSMTEEQREEFLNIQTEERQILLNALIEYKSGKYDKIPIIAPYKQIEWLNKNHFDYRGLIEKGLAIDATGLNIY